MCSLKSRRGKTASASGTKRSNVALDLQAYDQRYLEAMTRLYNEQASHEPHVANLTPELFLSLIQTKSYFNASDLLVALERGRVAGWIHSAVSGATETWLGPQHRYARISMLVYRPSQLKVGLSLVEAALKSLASRGHDRIWVMHAEGGYPFYRGLFEGGEYMCPASLPHLHLAFVYHGCKATSQSIFKLARFDEAPPLLEAQVPTEYAEAALSPPHATVAESWVGFGPRVIYATLDGGNAGTIGWVMQPHLTAKLGVPCANIYMLGVAGQHQRKGIAAALVSRAARAAYAAGARRMTVGSQVHNQAAHNTYDKLGFVAAGLSIGREWSVNGR